MYLRSVMIIIIWELPKAQIKRWQLTGLKLHIGVVATLLHPGAT
jgi:hypothetical protein